MVGGRWSTRGWSARPGDQPYRRRAATAGAAAFAGCAGAATRRGLSAAARLSRHARPRAARRAGGPGERGAPGRAATLAAAASGRQAVPTGDRQRRAGPFAGRDGAAPGDGRWLLG